MQFVTQSFVSREKAAVWVCFCEILMHVSWTTAAGHWWRRSIKHKTNKQTKLFIYIFLPSSFYFFIIFFCPVVWQCWGVLGIGNNQRVFRMKMTSREWGNGCQPLWLAALWWQASSLCARWRSSKVANYSDVWPRGDISSQSLQWLKTPRSRFPACIFGHVSVHFSACRWLCANWFWGLTGRFIVLFYFCLIPVVFECTLISLNSPWSGKKKSVKRTELNWTAKK